MNLSFGQLMSKWTRRTLYFGLIVATPAVAVAALVNQVFFSLALAIPLLLVANAYVLALIEQLRKQVDEVGKVRDEIRHLSSFNARIYRNDTDFYSDLRQSVLNARESVWVSYIRQFRRNAPRLELERHLDSCFEWSMGNGRHHFRRIMSSTTAAEVMTTGRRFDEQQLEYAKSADENGHSYLVKVVDWEPRHDTDSYSMTLIDDEEFYFILSGSQDEFWAFRVNSSNLAAGPLRDRYNNLWHDAHWLRDHCEGRCDCVGR